MIEQVNSTTWRSIKARHGGVWETEIGDAQDAANFHAQVKAKRWDNECNFSIRLPLPGTVTPSQNGETIEFTNISGITGQIYETADGFKFDIILASRPGFNGIVFTVQHKNVQYLYQPVDLTPFEIAKGNIRPDEIKGSYAVYHGQGKRDNAYQTGKMMHIKRPVLIDALGARSWVEMIITPIDADTASVQYNFDSAWLDSAVYPVTIDPTFGYSSVPGTLDNTNDYVFGTKHNFGGTTGSTIDDYNVYISWDTVGTHTIRQAIYDHNGTDDEPENVLEQVSQSTTVTTSGAWYTTTAAGTQTMTNSTDYWLMQCADGSGFNTFYDVDAAFRSSYQGPSITTFPDPYGTSSGFVGWKLGHYVNYTEPGAGGLPAGTLSLLGAGK